MKAGFSFLAAGLLISSVAAAQELLPRDNGLAEYHKSPDYRESESHPLRIAAYAIHPVGWLAREVVFRPISYLISGNKYSRSIFGYREPFDYRHADCFTAGDETPDCRTMPPYANLGGAPLPAAVEAVEPAPEIVAKAESKPAEEVVFPTVAFDFDKSTLNPLGQERVDQAAKLLELSPTLRIVIEGHADNRGTDDYNMKLGMRRAETVRSALITHGIAADRMSTVSYGESRPVDASNNEGAWAKNRRVEFVVKSELSAAVTTPAATAAEATEGS